MSVLDRRGRSSASTCAAKFADRPLVPLTVLELSIAAEGFGDAGTSLPNLQVVVQVKNGSAWVEHTITEVMEVGLCSSCSLDVCVFVYLCVRKREKREWESEIVCACLRKRESRKKAEKRARREV